MAMRVTKTMRNIRGRRYRITREDSCGTPVYGDNGQAVTTGVITATFTANSNTRDALQVFNSNGDLCIDEPAIVNLSGYTVEVAFCGMSPDVFEMMTGMPVKYDAFGAAVGIKVDIGVDLESFAFGLEIWTGLATDDACGQVGEVSYGYILLPFLKGGRLSDFTVQNGEINFTISDATTRKGGSWGKGPYNVEVNPGPVAGPLLEAITSTEVMLIQLTNVAPPEDTDGNGRPLLNPTWTELTDLDATPDDLEVAFDITPAIGVGEGAYYDFGDGTWDWVTTAGGDTTHTYAEAGTYTATASVNGVVVEVEVTVTDGS